MGPTPAVERPRRAASGRGASRAWWRAANSRLVVLPALLAAAVVGATLTASTIISAPGLQSSVQIVLAVVLTYVATATVAAVVAGRAENVGDNMQRILEAVLRFPDQNPNPVFRTSPDGRLVYANLASTPITSALGVSVGQQIPGELQAAITRARMGEDAGPIEVRHSGRVFELTPVDVEGFEFTNIYGTDVTALRAVDRFPNDNPNPVLRTSPNGTLVYANPASSLITSALGVSVGETVPLTLRDAINRRLTGKDTSPIEVRGEGRVFELTPVGVEGFEFTNIYGTDATALRAVDKFPNENPNPVLRVSQEAVLAYANPASRLVRKAFGVEVGERIDVALWDQITKATEDHDDVLEIESDGRLFALRVVSLYEFESINIYGTDITAAREVERANAENERLLLNILPAPIADRLRSGETLIADRFDDLTVLFADVVDFTPFSSELPPREVLDVLNGVFSVFDDLADSHRLEKIKTIGDAYMVIGGLTYEQDQVERVARMGLDMIESMNTYRTSSGTRLPIRVGMHVGPAVAGVIGLKKFIYDVWGDTVNTASRMESQGQPGRLHVTQAAYERLKDSFELEPRGIIDIRGKGPMPTYFVLPPQPLQP